MPKYKIRDGLEMTIIPGVGVVKVGDVLNGDFGRFVPGKLQKVSDSAAAAPKAAPVPVSAPEPEPEPEEDSDDDLPSMDWRKDKLVAYAEERGVDGSGTKQEILDRIEEERG